MRYLFTIILLLNIAGFTSAQIEVNGGMGIEFTRSQDLNDYFLRNRLLTFEELDAEFRSNVVFFAEGLQFISENVQLGIGYDFSINSHSFGITDLGNYKMEWVMHKPSVMGYYVFPGKGYNFKLGGGIGLRYVSATETIPTMGGVDYSGLGAGFLFKALGNTALGQDLYAQIGGSLAFDFPGVPDNNGDPLSYNNEEKEEVNFNSFSFGIRLGLTYYFN